MKIEIKNWEAIEKSEQGEDLIAIPLPGCIIKGAIDDKEVKIKTKDVNLSNLTITDEDNTIYRLSGAKSDYIGALNHYIETGKDKGIIAESIDIKEEIERGYER